jgi:hypothetical protein
MRNLARASARTRLVMVKETGYEGSRTTHRKALLVRWRGSLVGIPPTSNVARLNLCRRFSSDSVGVAQRVRLLLLGPDARLIVAKERFEILCKQPSLPSSRFRRRYDADWTLSRLPGHRNVPPMGAQEA